MAEPPSKERKQRCKTHVGPWRLGRTLGKGASGRVRLAKHASTGRLAAVKIVTKAKQELPVQNKHVLPVGLEREVVIMKLIDHPHVIGLYDVWENKNELYLVVEYVEGGELFEFLIKRGCLPEDEAIRYFRQIISGIEYCHKFSICHRDLKPENILLDKNNNIKIADFGMAAIQPAGSMLYTSCGSPHYAAPEIISGKPYNGPKADIWSAGIILFALLTGYLPFDDDNLRQLLLKVKHGRFTMPKEGLSHEARDFLRRVLEVDPEKRICIQEMWQHSLFKKRQGTEQEALTWSAITPLDLKEQILLRSEIDKEVLRNLRILWNGEDERTILDRLLNREANQEKLFYHLLSQYRKRQLEDFHESKVLRSRKQSHINSSTKSRPPNLASTKSRKEGGKRGSTISSNAAFKATNVERAMEYRPRSRLIAVSKRHRIISHSSLSPRSTQTSSVMRGVSVSSAARRNISFHRHRATLRGSSILGKSSTMQSRTNRSSGQKISRGIRDNLNVSTRTTSGITTNVFKTPTNSTISCVTPMPANSGQQSQSRNCHISRPRDPQGMEDVRTGYLDEVIDHLNCLVDHKPGVNINHSRNKATISVDAEQGKLVSAQGGKMELWEMAPPTPLKIPGKTEGVSRENLGMRTNFLSQGSRHLSQLPTCEGTERTDSLKPLALPSDSRVQRRVHSQHKSTGRNDQVNRRDPQGKPKSRITNKTTLSKSLLKRQFFGLFPGKVRLTDKASRPQTGSQESMGSDSVTRSWFSKLFGVKPISCSFYFGTVAGAALSAVCNLLQLWKDQNYGVIEIQQNAASLTVRIRIGKRNLKKFRPVSLLVEAVQNDSGHQRKEASSLVRFTQAAGSASSFQKVVEAIIEKLRRSSITIDSMQE